jgi:hypothetical protein
MTADRWLVVWAASATHWVGCGPNFMGPPEFMCYETLSGYIVAAGLYSQGSLRDPSPITILRRKMQGRGWLTNNDS